MISVLCDGFGRETVIKKISNSQKSVVAIDFLEKGQKLATLAV
jgi:hypothetical protein